MTEDITKYTDKQKQIVESARSIISSKGIEKLTIHEIAKDLGVTDGALYRHFKSKKEIISLLIEDIERTLLNTVRDTASKTSNPVNKLENILVSHLSYAEQRKGVSFIVINEALNLQDKILKRKMLKVIHKYLKEIKSILLEGVEAGKIRKDVDSVSASIAFFGMVQSMVTLWALSNFRYPLKKHYLELFDIYKKGVMIR